MINKSLSVSHNLFNLNYEKNEENAETLGKTYENGKMNRYHSFQDVTKLISEDKKSTDNSEMNSLNSKSPLKT